MKLSKKEIAAVNAVRLVDNYRRKATKIRHNRLQPVYNINEIIADEIKKFVEWLNESEEVIGPISQYNSPNQMLRIGKKYLETRELRHPKYIHFTATRRRP